MFAIAKREITSFFSSPVAYLVIVLFLLINGLFLWVFHGPFNIFDYGFADLGNFFLLSPWILLFLIPAITMRSFAEEKRTGTLELLFIKPISLTKIVLGKYLGALAMVLVTLTPTLLYVYTISELGSTAGNFDAGIMLGSYLALLFLSCVFTAIGIFASTLTSNQVIAFIVAMLSCFFLYSGMDGVSTLFSSGELILYFQRLGLMARFENMSSGILDSRDFVYFVSLSAFFIYLAISNLQFHRR